MIANISRATILSSALLFCLTPTASNAGALTPQYDKCMQASTANIEYNNCGQDEIDRQEKRLNAAWTKAFGCFSSTDGSLTKAKQDLLDEQRLWVKWKESACDFYGARDSSGAATFGREGEVISFPACRANVIAGRAAFLEQLGKEQCDR